MGSATNEGSKDPEVLATLDDQGFRTKSFGSPSSMALVVLFPVSTGLGWAVLAEATD